jgi:membrane dipeptidase
MNRDRVSRRGFVRTAIIGASATMLPAVRSLGQWWPAPSWPGYERAIVIDNLATPGPFNVGSMYDRPWTPEMIANARASGITAVNVTVGLPTPGDAFNGTIRTLAFLGREMFQHPDVFIAVHRVADIARAKETKRLGLIAGFQDTVMLESDVSRVDLFHGLGVRIIQLTYNLRNLVGDGCLEPGNAGLSNFGRDVVTRMNDRGVLVDVSHCGRRTTDDAIAHSRKPVAITHSGCAALADVPRNKTDEQLKAMARKGGVIGVYTMPFLRVSGQPTAADFVRHVEHAVRVCGEDHVGVGSDNSITPLEITPAFRAQHAEFVRIRRSRGISAPGEDENVFAYVPDLNSPRRMELIADALATRGYSSARIEKILGGNWLRLFGDVWT